MGRRAHIGIDTLVQCLPPTARRAVDATVDLLLVIILGILIYYGVLLCAMTAQVTTPSLGIPVALVYGAAPVGAILMLLHHAHRLATTYLPRRTDVTASRQARG
jgi:TRAP-type C4-dicarboxylate transport system permease small subunit